MPFLIKNVHHAVPMDGYRYVFDCNIWMAVLEDSFNTAQYEPYVNFFNKIVSLQKKSDAGIVLPGLILSELLNRLINDIYFQEFIQENPTKISGNKRHDFKNVYRPTEAYQKDIENACAGIRSFHRKVNFISDELSDFAFKDLIKNIPTYLDINDHILAKMAATQGLVIVTADGDFKVEDISILTANQRLLNLV